MCFVEGILFLMLYFVEVVIEFDDFLGMCDLI